MSRSLSNLALKETSIVQSFTNDEVGSKLMSMGMRPGTMVQLVRRAPFKGGCYVKAGNYYFALRRNEAACILVGE